MITIFDYHYFLLFEYMFKWFYFVKANSIYADQNLKKGKFQGA